MRRTEYRLVPVSLRPGVTLDMLERRFNLLAAENWTFAGLNETFAVFWRHGDGDNWTFAAAHTSSGRAQDVTTNVTNRKADRGSLATKEISVNADDLVFRVREDLMQKLDKRDSKNHEG